MRSKSSKCLSDKGAKRTLLLIIVRMRDVQLI